MDEQGKIHADSSSRDSANWKVTPDKLAIFHAYVGSAGAVQRVRRRQIGRKRDIFASDSKTCSQRQALLSNQGLVWSPFCVIRLARVSRTWCAARKIHWLPA